jgi:hypothetical protein
LHARHDTDHAAHDDAEHGERDHDFDQGEASPVPEIDAFHQLAVMI